MVPLWLVCSKFSWSFSEGGVELVCTRDLLSGGRSVCKHIYGKNHSHPVSHRYRFNDQSRIRFRNNFSFQTELEMRSLRCERRGRDARRFVYRTKLVYWEFLFKYINIFISSSYQNSVFSSEWNATQVPINIIFNDDLLVQVVSYLALGDFASSLMVGLVRQTIFIFRPNLDLLSIVIFCLIWTFGLYFLRIRLMVLWENWAFWLRWRLNVHQKREISNWSF